MVECAAPHRLTRPLYRMERRSEAPQHSLSRLQHPVSDSTLGARRASGISYSRQPGGADLRRLAADVWAPDLLPGDVCESRTIPWDLLPGVQLGVARQDDRTRQAIQQLRTEPID